MLGERQDAGSLGFHARINRSAEAVTTAESGQGQVRRQYLAASRCQVKPPLTSLVRIAQHEVIDPIGMTLYATSERRLSRR